MDVARNDCFGIARNTTSEVWFTVADGVPTSSVRTIENSNVNTVQYVVTTASRSPTCSRATSPPRSARRIAAA
jgi:hypothetical protein